MLPAGLAGKGVPYVWATCAVLWSRCALFGQLPVVILWYGLFISHIQTTQYREEMKRYPCQMLSDPWTTDCDKGGKINIDLLLSGDMILHNYTFWKACHDSWAHGVILADSPV